MTTTLEIADSTTEPRIPAVHRPITSSITNSTAEIGALNAAASPAAAPTGAISRMRSRDSRIFRPSTDASACADLQRGIFRPQRMSRPDGQRRRDELPDGRPKRNLPVVDVERSLGLIHPAAARPGKEVNHQDRDHQSRQRRR